MGLTENELKIYAHHMAWARPERSAHARRTRARFVVEHIWEEGTRYIGLRVTIDDPEFSRSHRHPGQYTTFEFGALRPRFLVISNAPGARSSSEHGESWEFLIDRTSNIGQQIVEENPLRVGHKVVLSPAEGSGFPIQTFDGHSALLFATGAGIAALRPVLQYWHLHPGRAPANIALYYGEREPAHFAYRAELAAWRQQGMRFFCAIENLEAERRISAELSQISKGFQYVQHAFEADAPDLGDAAVLVSGAPIMMQIVIEKLLRLGVDPGRIHINV